MLSTLGESRWHVLSALIAASCVIFAYWYWSTNAARLKVAVDNFANCERLTAEIRSLKLSPQTAKTENWSQDDLSSAIEASAAGAQLDRDRILRIDPQAPRRLAKTDYVEQATEVELSDVSMRQLVDFLFGISDRDDQLENATLRLRVPHSTEDGNTAELWSTDLILTQRIYSPAPSRR